MALDTLGLPAFRVPGYTGVWVGEAGDASTPDGRILAGRVRKIASIGVHVSRWITWHGFALNVTEDPLRAFELIVPCGIDGVHMTSLRSEGVEVGPGSRRLLDAVGRAFGAAFDVESTIATDLPVPLRA